jgi:hypothetical protein
MRESASRPSRAARSPTQGSRGAPRGAPPGRAARPARSEEGDPQGSLRARPVKVLRIADAHFRRTSAEKADWKARIDLGFQTPCRRGRVRGYMPAMARTRKFNPTGIPLNKKDPLRQTGILLVRPSLQAIVGKKSTSLRGAFELQPVKNGPVRIVISDRKVRMINCEDPEKAFQSNLKFFRTGRTCCKQLKYVVRHITRHGTTRRDFMRLRYASHLQFIGRPARAFQVVKSLSQRIGCLIAAKKLPRMLHEERSRPSYSSSRYLSD